MMNQKLEKIRKVMVVKGEIVVTPQLPVTQQQRRQPRLIRAD
ncbi:MAG: hypothetical protein QXH44_10100 [Pyrobaculum sp.]